jgi:hypothetical protein
MSKLLQGIVVFNGLKSGLPRLCKLNNPHVNVIVNTSEESLAVLKNIPGTKSYYIYTDTTDLAHDISMPKLDLYDDFIKVKN